MSLPVVRPDELDGSAQAWMEAHKTKRGAAWLDWCARIALFQQLGTDVLVISGPGLYVPLVRGVTVAEALHLLARKGGPKLGDPPCQSCTHRSGSCQGWEDAKRCCTIGRHYGLATGHLTPTAYELEAAAEGLLEVELPPQPEQPTPSPAPAGDHSLVTTPTPGPAAAPPVARQLSLL
jgi:hypothetical protein